VEGWRHSKTSSSLGEQVYRLDFVVFCWRIWASHIIEVMRKRAAALEVASSSAPTVRKKPSVIAVDGSAASGKSTVGRKLAERLGYPFLDTGLMYRAVTLAALDRGLDIGDSEALSRLAGSLTIGVGPPRAESLETCSITVDGIDVTDELRRSDVEEAVSLVSRVGGVREALVRQQREIAGRQPMVMAGRDIGTVVLPRADLKVYLDASISERARRRHSEFEDQGRAVTRSMVLEDLRRRDQIDSERSVSPLRPAEDAVVISTDGLSKDQVLQRVLGLVDEAA
jgi:CMP/dCMP kinase